MMMMAIPDVESSAVRNMVFMYSPDGTNVYGSRTGEFDGIWSV